MIQRSERGLERLQFLHCHLAERTETRSFTVARPDGTERELLVVITELRATADRRAYEIRLLSGA